MTAFYLPLRSGEFRSTEHTVGPWAESEQHAGPPAALLVRALESILPTEGSLARVSVDLLAAVPVAVMTIRSRLVRPGRSVRLAEAELAVDGRVVARAAGWWHRDGDTAAVTTGTSAPPARPGPQAQDEHPWPGGYLRAMEWRWIRSSLADLGPASVWCRMRVPLVEGEEPTATQRVLVTADSGNGISAVLPPQRWLFVNTELTVHLFRRATGEWVGMDAQTTIGPAGCGLAASRLYDASGEVGRGAQALLVRPRHP